MYVPLCMTDLIIWLQSIMTNQNKTHVTNYDDWHKTNWKFDMPKTVSHLILERILSLAILLHEECYTYV